MVWVYDPHPSSTNDVRLRKVDKVDMVYKVWSIKHSSLI